MAQTTPIHITWHDLSAKLTEKVILADCYGYCQVRRDASNNGSFWSWQNYSTISHIQQSFLSP